MDEGGGWSDGGSSSRKRRKIDPPTAEAEAKAEAEAGVEAKAKAEDARLSAPEEEAPLTSSATTTSPQSSRGSSLSPPPDKEEGVGEDVGVDLGVDVDVDLDVPLRRLIPPPNPDDWSAVIARARSHPREAAESYFGPPSPPSLLVDHRGDEDDDPHATGACHHRCRPLHAMLLHDPPPPAVEAVLRAHPEAVLDATTFGGATALRIAAERTPPGEGGGGGPALPPRLQVLRLLLVAELAMARKGESERRGWRGRGGDTRPSLRPGGGDDSDGGRDRNVGSDANSVAFFGHNPIGWMTEPSVSARTAAMLLKWYPVGAFQRRRSFRRLCPWDDEEGVEKEEGVEEEEGGDDDVDDGRGGGALGDRSQDDDADDSPLIRIVDDFARDNYDGLGGGAADADDDDGGGDSDEVWNIGGGGGGGISNSDDFSSSGQSTGSSSRIASRLHLRRECRRREQRWEKFLHILYATDSTLQSTRKPPPHDDGGTLEEEAAIAKAADGSSLDPTDRRTKSEADAVAANATTAGPSISIVAVTSAPPLSEHDASTSVRENDHDHTEAPSSTNAAAAATMQAGTVAADALNGTKKSSVTPFHPVHAWLRCLTSPNLGLEHCQAYGVWSVLRDMEWRIPDEFTVRDDTDGNRTAFQTLAECKAKDCKLCPAEIRDIVECLMAANHRSAFLPRKSDGRLIGHVALENGWPCKDLFSRKTSATCA